MGEAESRIFGKAKSQEDEKSEGGSEKNGEMTHRLQFSSETCRHRQLAFRTPKTGDEW